MSCQLETIPCPSRIRQCQNAAVALRSSSTYLFSTPYLPYHVEWSFTGSSSDTSGGMYWFRREHLRDRCVHTHCASLHLLLHSYSGHSTCSMTCNFLRNQHSFSLHLSFDRGYAAQLALHHTKLFARPRINKSRLRHYHIYQSHILQNVGRT